MEVGRGVIPVGASPGNNSHEREDQLTLYSKIFCIASVIALLMKQRWYSLIYNNVAMCMN